MADLAQRVEGRFQITTDGFDVSACRAGELRSRNRLCPTDQTIHHGRARFAGLVQGGAICSHDTSPISGNPNEDRISTSHVERVNLSVRTYGGLPDSR